MAKRKYELIQEINKLTTEYIQLEDSLANAGEFSRLEMEIEEAATELCEEIIAGILRV